MKPPMQNGIDMKGMYAGVYMTYRAIEDNYEGSLTAHKASGSPENMDKFISGKQGSLGAADSERQSVGSFLSDEDREEVERKVESLISFRRLQGGA